MEPVEQIGADSPDMRVCRGPEAVSADLKRSIRKEKTAARRALPSDVRKRADASIVQRIFSILSSCPDCTALVGYISDGTEPDLTPVLRDALSSGKTLCLPRFRDAEHYDLAVVRTLALSDSKFGIPEPPASAPSADGSDLENAVWLVPGVAFDDCCRRLGRGKGVYDRLLSGRRPKLAIGIFYECQRCGSVPVSPHDQPLDLIITEDRAIPGASLTLSIQL